MSSSSDDDDDDDSSSSSGDESHAATAAAGPIRIRVAAPDDAAPPVLCAFPGGLPAALQRKNKDYSDLPTFLYNNQQQQQQQQQQPKGKSTTTSLLGQDDACYYAASISDSDYTKQSVQYCVGVFDKQSNTLTLSQAACRGTVFALNQSVRNYQTHTESSAEVRLSLAQDFSSAKKQKMLRSQAANRVKADSVVGAGKLLMQGVQQTMSASNQQAMAVGRDEQQQNAAIQAATEAWRKDFLPQFDETATEASRIYKPKKIVSKESWKQAGRVVEACSHKDDVAGAILDVGDASATVTAAAATDDASVHRNKVPQKRWFTTIEDLVMRLCSESADHLDKDRLQAAILVNHFATLYDMLGRRRFFQGPTPDRSRFFGTPIEFASFFLERFSTSTMDTQGSEGRVMSKADRDRCMVHMLILYVFADSGNAMRSANVKPLLDDIKQDLIGATQLLRQAGFTIERKSGTSTTTVYLKPPLTFPSGVRKRAATSGR